MPIYQEQDADLFEAHGSRFASLVSTRRGGEGLCVWRVEVPAGLAGVPHRPSREEVLIVRDGELLVEIEGAERSLGPGDVVHVPSGSLFRIDGGPDGASAWVATTAGLEAELPDGSRIAPPWAQ